MSGMHRDIIRVDSPVGFSLEEKIDDQLFRAKVVAPGSVSPNRAVDVLNKRIRLNILTDFDKEAIKMAESKTA